MVNATDPDFLTAAEIAGRRQALEYVRFLTDWVPGYEHASLATLGTQIGVRETRRVYGDYRLTRDDVLSARRFDDAVGLCGAPIEDHHAGADTRWQYLPDGQAVDIPFRTLLVLDAADGLPPLPDAASARRTTPTRPCAQWRNAWRWARPPAVPPRWRPRLDTTRATSRYDALQDRLVANGAILQLTEPVGSE